MIDPDSPEGRAIARELKRIADQPETRAEKARKKRIAHWLNIKRQAENQLKALGYQEDA